MGDVSGVVGTVRAGLLPKVGAAGDGRPYTDQDFAGHLDVSYSALEASRQLLSIPEVMSGDVGSVAEVSIVLLCGEHTDASKPWTQPRHVQAAYQARPFFVHLIGNTAHTPPPCKNRLISER